MSENKGLIATNEMKAIMRLDDTVRQSRVELMEAERSGNDIMRGMVLARATRQLRDMLTDSMMADLEALQNTPLGFRTDKPDGYPVDVLRDICIVALLDGARPTGNEFNVIAGNYYRTVEQLRRRIQEFPGLSNFRFDLGVPTMGKGGALVPAMATWKLDGVADCLQCHASQDVDTRIPVRVNSGMGTDAIHGKARRKLYYRVLERLTGSNLDEDEQEAPENDADAIDAEYSDPEPEAVTGDPGAPGDHVDQTEDQLDTIWANFLQLQTLTLCKQYHEELTASGCYDEGACQIITQFMEDRCQAIRDARGPRSKPTTQQAG